MEKSTSDLRDNCLETMQEQLDPRLRVEMASSFLASIKNKFKETNPNTYHTFLAIMQQFQAKTLAVPQLIYYVSELFQDHPDLIEAFNTYLPSSFSLFVEETSSNSYTVKLTEDRPGGKVQTVLYSTGADHSVTSSHSPSLAQINKDEALGSCELKKPNMNDAVDFLHRLKLHFNKSSHSYEEFLHILFRFKSCRDSNDVPGDDVYQAVLKLFENGDDLLKEFRLFLADTISSSLFNAGEAMDPWEERSDGGGPPCKRRRTEPLQDVSLAQAAALADPSDFEMFDQIHRVVDRGTYDNLLRCLTIFNDEVIGREELVTLVEPLLQHWPRVMDRFRAFVLRHRRSAHHSRPYCRPGQSGLEGQPGHSGHQGHHAHRGRNPAHHGSASSVASAAGKLRATEEVVEIDLSTCRPMGTSYREVPPHARPTCSGRTSLDRAVLNDTWMLYPTWNNEETSVGHCKKNAFEEHLFSIEDERFELDYVLETNRSVIDLLASVNAKLDGLQENKAAFRMEQELTTFQKEAIKRLYGAPRHEAILQGLKDQPWVAVPMVLGRLRGKEEEWREARRKMNEALAAGQERSYLKSLDVQGPLLKAQDIKLLRSKNLMTELTDLEGQSAELEVVYSTERVMADAADLVLHHVKRHCGCQKDKAVMKAVLRRLLPDLSGRPRLQAAVDELEVLGDWQLMTSPKTTETERRVFLGTKEWYLVLRYFQLLCGRLLELRLEADRLVAEEQAQAGPERWSAAVALMLRRKPDIATNQYYRELLNLVKAVLDGSLTAADLEGRVRQMFTVKAHPGYTLDRMVTHCVRQLLLAVTDKTALGCLELFRTYRNLMSAPGCHRHETQHSYYRKVLHFLFGKACYKITVDPGSDTMSFAVLRESPLHPRILRCCASLLGRPCPMKTWPGRRKARARPHVGTCAPFRVRHVRWARNADRNASDHCPWMYFVGDHFLYRKYRVRRSRTAAAMSKVAKWRAWLDRHTPP